MPTKKEIRGWIYCIRNKINGKQYIGRTNDFHRRYIEHFGKKDSCTILRKAFKKYGKDNFEMFPIVSFAINNKMVLDEILNVLEKHYIRKYDTYKKGYNATLGGEGNSGWITPEETLKKRSRSLKGKPFSEEHKAKCRIARLGKCHTEEAKEAIRKALLSRDNSVYQKIGEKLKGKKRNHEMIMQGAIKRRKSVLQYSLNGDFITEYSGSTLVGKYDETNIIACCKGKINSAYGYVWRYKEDNNIPLKIEVSMNTNFKNRPVLQFDKLGNFIQEFSCAKEASELAGINRSALSNCLAGISKTCGNYIWSYKERKEVSNA